MGNFFEFIRSNFFHAAPILAIGAFAVAVMLERWRALFQVFPLKDSPGFFDKISELVMGGKVGEAIALCDRFPNKPVASVTKQALLRCNQPENLIEQGVELAVGEATQSIQKRTQFLSTIANVATLLGLFGTIAGLIHSFEAVGHADAQQKSAMLAAGISTAMNATMLGLGVAIPCMLAFSFLMNRTNKLTADVDHGAARVIDILKLSYYQAESEALNPRLEGKRSQEDDDAEMESSSSNGSGGKVVSLRKAA